MKLVASIKDSSGNPVITSSETPSAVNGITITNAATGNGPTISASGSDTNIDLNLSGKGTGRVNLGSGGASFIGLKDTDLSNWLDILLGSNLTADRTLTLITGDSDRILTLGGNATLNGGTHSGTNTGDQASIVGITGTKSQFDTAVTDGNFLYVGDITQYTAENAQDDVAAMIVDTDTVNFTYTDGTPELKADVRLQMSLTSDSSGIKLSGDSASPGNNYYYGTDGSGTKGYHQLTGITTQTGTTYSLAATDGSTEVRFSNAAAKTVTVLGTGTLGTGFFAVLTNIGAGDMAIVPDTGVTLRNDTADIPQYGTVTVRAIGTNEYILTPGLTGLSAFIRTLLDDADASTARSTLGLGTLATQSGTFSGTSSGTNTGDQNLFSTIAVSGQSNVVADSVSDTLTLIAGTNVTITTNATNDEITIAASGTGGGVDTANSPNANEFARFTDADTIEGRTVSEARSDLSLDIFTAVWVIDGGGSAITTGVKGYLRIPYAGTITAWRLLADQSGSIVIDVWKDTYANYPPTVADTIAGSEKPTLSSATKNEDTALSTWTTSVSAGDILGFNVDSASTVTRVTLEIVCTRT